jgi:GntR family transcriptional regulator/MocR family aminotransferase
LDFQIAITGLRPLTRQIYDQIRSAVLEGRLRRGERLPSTRELADQLNVSRKTVVLAYDMLLAEGIIVSRLGSGTYVEDLGVAPRRMASPVGPIAVAPHWQKLPSLPAFPRQQVPFDFGVGVPDLAHFPWRLWGSILKSRSRLAPQSAKSYIRAAGYSPLRHAIAGYVGFSRGVRCTPDDVIVTNGAQQAFQLIAQVLVQPGTVVAMEYPGYSMARWVFLAQGAKVVDIPVDREGLMVRSLPRNAKLVFTTPSHQFPTSVVMSYSRRVALLEWARSRGAAIVEDDYDSEFRFEGRPLESLQSMDPEAAIYVGTFSKSLFPGLRIGFMVPPQPLRATLVTAKHLTDWHSPLLPQAAVAAFISDGHFGRHIRKVRRLYSDRRNRLIGELQRCLSDSLAILPSGTGLHLAATLKQQVPADALAAAALSAGIRLFPMPEGIAFGIGTIDVSQIRGAIEKLRDVLRTLRSRTKR